MLNDRGFTLIELTLVVVLIAIVSTMAMPRLMPFLFNDSLKEGARKLTYFIQQTALTAEQTGRPLTIEYLPVSRKFIRKDTQQTDISEDINGLQLPEGVTLRGISFYYSEEETVQQGKLRFNGKGYLEPCLIYLQKEKDEVVTLQLSPFLGNVQIYSEYISFKKELFSSLNENSFQFTN